ncbi:unnamed protein product, partial [Discosporangium mesarthrocarpum]
MRTAWILSSVIVSLLLVTSSLAGSLYDFTVKDASGEDVSLAKYKDKPVVLVVNVASHCGYTDSNYRQLQRLYNDHADKGLEVLAFPCNQFGAQEPGTPNEIAAFVDQHFGVTFPLLAKVDVNGEDTDPLFTWLKEASGDTLGIPWNFSKFLILRGETVSRFSHEV